MVQYRKTNYVVEADIKGFFDNVDYGWLIKMLEYDIADRKFLGAKSWKTENFLTSISH